MATQTVVLDSRAGDDPRYADTERAWHFAGSDRSALSMYGEPAGREVEGPPLGEAADTLRDEYLERMGDLAVRLDSPAWWESTAAEKQVAESAVLVIAALVCRARHLAESDPDLLVVCQDAVVERLVRNVPGPDSVGLRTSAATVSWSRTLFIGAHLRRIAAELPFLSASGARGGAPLTLLVTWFDRRSVDAGGRYADPYFGDLAHRLSDGGRPFAILPIVVPGTDESWARRAMRETGLRFVPPHAFLTPALVARACTAPPVEVPCDAGAICGVPLGPLLAIDTARDMANRSVWFDRLLAMVPARMRSAGIEIERVVYPFENVSWEKLFVPAIRASYPRAKLVGYQHSSISARKTSYFMAAREAAIAPLPDRIVTSGRAAFDLLSPVYGRRMVRGAALRYAAALHIRPLAAPANGSILVALSLDRAEVGESLRCVAAALEGSTRQVLIKIHPTAKRSDVLDAAGFDRLPAPLRFEDGTIGELLPGAACMVATSSTAVLEALAARVPVVLLELSSAIVTGPLIGAGRSVVRAYGAAELSAAVEDAAAAGQRIRDEQGPAWAATVREFLDPAGSETYAALLDD